LWQLTSTVQGRAREDVGLVEVLEALFPCGSVTGAPKLSTMALIAELEDAPRGAYCGALGWIAPGPRARFNVAIRTVTIDAADGSAVYGAGGGVTWASTAEAEYEELLVKAAVLPTGTREPFAPLETVAVQGEGARNLAAQLERLLDPAAHCGTPVARDGTGAGPRARGCGRARVSRAPCWGRPRSRGGWRGTSRRIGGGCSTRRRTSGARSSGTGSRRWCVPRSPRPAPLPCCCGSRCGAMDPSRS